MKISLNWLKSYIETSLPAEEIAKILTDIGLEVEGLEQIETVRGVGTDEDDDLAQVLSGKHFLAAEDNFLNAGILTDLLEMEGATVEIVENGKLAVERFERCEPGEFDAILMDVQMPVMNGHAAAQAMAAGVTTMVEGTSTLVPPVADKGRYLTYAELYGIDAPAWPDRRTVAPRTPRNRRGIARVRGAIGRTGGRRKGKGRRGGRK